MIGTFAVTPGDVYVVAVGGAGAQYGNSRGGTGVLFETIPLIVAGGGGGGYREGKSPVTPYTASPLNAPTGLTVSATAYPIVVGGGGAGGGPIGC